MSDEQVPSGSNSAALLLGVVCSLVTFVLLALFLSRGVRPTLVGGCIAGGVFWLVLGSVRVKHIAFLIVSLVALISALA